MSSREVLYAVIDRLTKFRRLNFFLALLFPLLLFVALAFAAEYGFLAKPVAILAFAVSAVVFLWFVDQGAELLPEVRMDEAAKIVDRATGAKERFLTVAAADHANSSTVALRSIEAQADRFAAGFKLEQETPFTLMRSARISSFLSPLPLGVILFFLLFYHDTSSAPREKLIAHKRADELRDLVEKSNNLPQKAKEQLLNLADVLEDEGLNSAGSVRELEMTEEKLEDLKELPGEKLLEDQNALPQTETPSASGYDQSSSSVSSSAPQKAETDGELDSNEMKIERRFEETPPQQEKNQPGQNQQNQKQQPNQELNPPANENDGAKKAGEPTPPKEEQQTSEAEKSSAPKEQKEQGQSSSVSSQPEKKPPEQQGEQDKESSTGTGSGQNGKQGSGQESENGQGKQGEKAGKKDDPSSGKQAKESDEGQGQGEKKDDKKDVTGVGEGQGKGKSGEQKEQQGETQSGNDSSGAKEGDAKNTAGSQGGNDSKEKNSPQEKNQEKNQQGNGGKQGSGQKSSSKDGNQQGGSRDGKGGQNQSGKQQSGGQSDKRNSEIDAVKEKLENIRKDMAGKQSAEDAKSEDGQKPQADQGAKQSDKKNQPEQKNGAGQQSSGNKDEQKGSGQKKSAEDKNQPGQGGDKAPQKDSEKAGEKSGASSSEKSADKKNAEKSGAGEQSSKASAKDQKETGSGEGKEQKPDEQKQPGVGGQAPGENQPPAQQGQPGKHDQAGNVFEPQASPLNKNSPHPDAMPQESDNAQRFGPFGDGGGEDLAKKKELGTQTVVIPEGEEKITVRTLGASDGKHYRSTGEAKSKLEIGSTEFEKPKSDSAESSQPIPVEYQDILR